MFELSADTLLTILQEINIPGHRNGHKRLPDNYVDNLTRNKKWT